MKLESVSAMLTALVLISASGEAQDTPAPASPGAPREKSPFSKITGIFDGPVRPIVSGVASGGGLGVGVRYQLPSGGWWETTAQTVVTFRRYWSAEVVTSYQGARGRVGAYGRIREMSQLSFFGPGTDSDLANRTNFLQRDPVVGARASLRLAPWAAAGGRVEELWPEIGPGRSTRYPTLEARFSEGDAPGLTAQPRFGRYEGFVELQAPAGAGEALNQGGRYRVAYALFDDQQFDRFAFRRLDLEARHKFSVFGPHRRLTLHGWIATTDTSAGNDVPFYLQPTLGAGSQLRTVDEDLIGSDGSRRTLRGFENFRFRDRNLLLLQVEYRVPIWGPFDATVFTDAGKVTSRRTDLNLSGLKRNYGVSLSVMRGPSTVARTDIGFGGGEGVNISFSFNVGEGDDVLH